MLLGHVSQAGTSSYGKHYELSSNQRRHQQSQTTTHVTGIGARDSPNDSDEELVMNTKIFDGTPTGSAEPRNVAGGIMVNTRVQVHHDDSMDSSRIPNSLLESRMY
jgi:hypothetical protein